MGKSEGSPERKGGTSTEVCEANLKTSFCFNRGGCDQAVQCRSFPCAQEILRFLPSLKPTAQLRTGPSERRDSPRANQHDTKSDDDDPELVISKRGNYDNMQVHQNSEKDEDDCNGFEDRSGFITHGFVGLIAKRKLMARIFR